MMPVQKFRSFEQAREALWTDPRDPSYARTLAWLWGLSSRLAGRHYPPGVYRYSSIEEANRERDAWETASATQA
jgi:hypothetical protein